MACSIYCWPRPRRVGGGESGFGIRDSGFGIRESGFGNRESGIGNRESGRACLSAFDQASHADKDR
ncbi:hypothetical protein BI317_21115 [Xanthomonas hortorum pv. gardneri]|nr:hypothetical protein BI317_21115 [Xanthomonas hortorum pv. gardneri]